MLKMKERLAKKENNDRGRKEKNIGDAVNKSVAGDGTGIVGGGKGAEVVETMPESASNLHDKKMEIVFKSKSMKYSIADTPVFIPIKLKRYGLSQVINHLLSLGMYLSRSCYCLWIIFYLWSFL
jgi:hypothetical protein